MTKILVELHLANARQTQVGTIPPGLKDSVFARYNIERSEFEVTLRHYSRNPEAFETLYNTVLDTLNAIESELRQNRYNSRPDNYRNRSGSSSGRSK